MSPLYPRILKIPLKISAVYFFLRGLSEKVRGQGQGMWVRQQEQVELPVPKDGARTGRVKMRKGGVTRNVGKKT